MPTFAEALRASAQRLGVDPVDLATVISFETGGTFSPSVYGGAGKRHLGLIQFNPANAQRYGANPRQTAAEQLSAVEKYLTATGVKPGMDRTHIYSAILAGSPYKQNISDTAQGGTPGGAAQKVREQMAAHERKAQALLGGAPLPPPRPTQFAAHQPAPPPARGTPEYPDSPLDRPGFLAASVVDPFVKLANERKEQQTQQALATAQQALANQPQPAPSPAPVAPLPPVDYSTLLMPRLRRGLLADQSLGLLGAP